MENGTPVERVFRPAEFNSQATHHMFKTKTVAILKTPIGRYSSGIVCGYELNGSRQTVIYVYLGRPGVKKFLPEELEPPSEE